MPKPTLFTAVSPFTGRAFTRRSLRAYSHAVIYHTPVDALRAGAEARIATWIAEADKYAMIAAVLEAEGEPAADHPLRSMRASTSYAEHQAGVRSEWDSIRYALDGRSVWGAISRADLAAKYRGYEAEVRARAAAVDPAAIVEPREEASFHHSAALAASKASGMGNTAIVEVR